MNAWLRRFAGARNGNVAILFAVLALPMFGIAGAAVDYGLAMRLAEKLQAATDATALALCQTPLTTASDKLQDQALAMMRGYMGPNVAIDPLAITQNPRQIALKAQINSAMLFGRILGTETIRPSGTSRCATPAPETFEIALVLDTTGSMDRSDGTTTKLQSLKTAATNFVNFVYKQGGSFAADSRISLVPFAAAVAIPVSHRGASWIDRTGRASYHWNNVPHRAGTNFKSRLDLFAKLASVHPGWAWAGCLEVLPYPLNVQDTLPSATNNNSYFVPMFAPDEPGIGSTTRTDHNGSRSFNSYIDDGDANNNNNCSIPNNITFNQRFGRACKYNAPKGAKPSANIGSNMPNGPNFGCIRQPLRTLSNDAAALRTAISDMVAAGTTNIHEGMMWGWRTLSPVSVFKDDATPPAAYPPRGVNKILVLMSDGENMWPHNDRSAETFNSRYSVGGYLKNVDGTHPTDRAPPNITEPREALDHLTAEACTNAKTAGVTIYTIGFSVPNDPISQKGLDLLRNCASTTDRFFLANDSNGLIAAFEKVATSVGLLRLTQ